MNTSLYWIAGIIFLFLWEVIYLVLLKTYSKKAKKEKWLMIKLTAFISALFVSLVICLAGDAITRTLRSAYCIHILTGIVALVIFFWINKYIAYKK